MSYIDVQTYDTSLDNYNEAEALQTLLRAIHAELKKDNERMERDNTDTCPSFSISIGGKSIAFWLGGPQAEALFDFIRHIADENMHNIDITKGHVQGWRPIVNRQHDYLVDCLKSAVAYCKSQFEESDIDWLPSVNFLDNTLQEADKFDMLKQYIDSLY